MSTRNRSFFTKGIVAASVLALGMMLSAASGFAAGTNSPKPPGPTPRVESPERAPRGVFVDRISSRNIGISWNTNFAFKRYFVTATPIGGGGSSRIVELRFDPPQAKGTATVSNLQPLTRYRIRVQGIDGIKLDPSDRNRNGRNAKRSVRQRVIGTVTATTESGISEG